MRRYGEDKCAALSKENAELRSELERLGRLKKTLEGEERVLKRIQNVEEDHRRHAAIIQNGIKKMFAIKLKEGKYKQATSPEYSKNLQGLRDITSKKRAEKDALQAEVADKRARLDALSREVQSKQREYGELEGKLIKLQTL